MDKWCLHKYTYNVNILRIMKMELGISQMSYVANLGGCTKYDQSGCGITARMP